MSNKFIKFNFCLIFIISLIHGSGNFGSVISIISIAIVILFFLNFEKQEKIKYFCLLGIIVVHMTFMININDSNLELAQIESVTLRITDYQSENSYIVELFLDKQIKLKHKMILYANQKFQIGDLVNCVVKINDLKKYRNKGSFDYDFYLKTRNIDGTCFLESINKIENNPSLIDKIRQKYLDLVINSSENILEEYRDIYQKLLTGRSFIDGNGVNRYREAGLAHILAISGLHIGILYAAIEFVLKIMQVERFYRGTLEILFLFILYIILGNQVTILRTALVLTVIILSKMFYKRTDFFNTLSFASFVILIIQPRYLYDAGFQLTFAAMIAIGIYNKIFRIKVKNKKLSDFILLPICIQIVLFPIVLWHFQEIHYWTLILNLLITPFFSILIIIVYSIILFGFFGLEFDFLYIISNGILYYNDFIIKFLKSFWKLEHLARSLSIIEAIYFYMIIIIFIYLLNEEKIIPFRMRKMKCYKIIFLMFVFGILWCFVLGIIDKSLEINFLDVGQGDCISLNYKSHHYLIDSGGDGKYIGKISKQVLKPYLYKQGKIPIEGCFITHFDYDHYGGLQEIIGSVPIGRIYFNKFTEKKETKDKFVEKAKKFNVLTWYVHPEQGISFNENVNLEIISPHNSYDLENDNSMIILIKAYGKNILFTGDMTKNAEKEVLRAINGMKIDVLKVAHHGSNGSTSAEFLDRIKPKIAIISVGKSNRYGHPSKELLERLDSRNIKTYRTDEFGEITLSIGPNYCIIDTYVDDKKANHGKSYFLSLVYLIVVGIGVSKCTIKNI